MLVKQSQVLPDLLPQPHDQGHREPYPEHMQDEESDLGGTDLVCGPPIPVRKIDDTLQGQNNSFKYREGYDKVDIEAFSPGHVAISGQPCRLLSLLRLLTGRYFDQNDRHYADKKGAVGEDNLIR